jgi:hypothetical protein
MYGIPGAGISAIITSQALFSDFCVKIVGESVLCKQTQNSRNFLVESSYRKKLKVVHNTCGMYSQLC